MKKKCADMEQSKQPRKKFSFSTRAKPSSSSNTQNKKADTAQNATPVSVGIAVAGSICVEQRQGETIDVNTLRKDNDTAQIQFLMRNCSNCNVVMYVV